MQHYIDSVELQGGPSCSGANVTVLLAGTQTPASLFSDQGVTPLSNPVVTDATGTFSFYVANGRYDLVVSGTGIVSKTESDVEIFDATTSFNVAGIVGVKRLKANQGTPLVAGDFALSAGWGTGATVTGVIGTDQGWTATVTAGTTPGANPTLTLTFHDGTWTNSPITVTKMTGGSGTQTNLTEAPTATTNVITFNGTPVATSTYTISSVAIGR